MTDLEHYREQTKHLSYHELTTLIDEGIFLWVINYDRLEGITLLNSDGYIDYVFHKIKDFEQGFRHIDILYDKDKNFGGYDYKRDQVKAQKYFMFGKKIIGVWINGFLVKPPVTLNNWRESVEEIKRRVYDNIPDENPDELYHISIQLEYD